MDHYAGIDVSLECSSVCVVVITNALLAVHAVLRNEFQAFQKQVRKMARSDTRARLLMSTPAVGPIVALTYASAIDDPVICGSKAGCRRDQ
jgi:hypothetical protein